MGNVIVGGILHVGNEIRVFLEYQEIQNHGNEWLAEVTTDDDNNNKGDNDTMIHWKPLKEWVERFEPEPIFVEQQESIRTREIKGAIRSTATQILLDTLDKRIVARVVRLILDVTSQILTLAELNVSDDNDVLKQILNNVNGIVLSYRFQHDDKKIKFEYYRKKATDNLTELLWEYLPKQDTAAALVKLEQQIKDTITQLRQQVKPIIESTLDNILESVHHVVDDKVKQRLEDSSNMLSSLKFEERLMQFDESAHQVSSKVEGMAVMAETVAIAADQAVIDVATTTCDTMQQKLEQSTMTATQTVEALQQKEQNKMLLQESNAASRVAAVQDQANTIQHDLNKTLMHDQEVVLEQTKAVSHAAAAAVLEQSKIVEKESALVAEAVHDKANKAQEMVLRQDSQILDSFVDLVKTFLKQKLDRITSQLMEYMDHLFLSFYEAHVVLKMAETKSTNTLPELQDKMYHRVEQRAKFVKEQINAQVKAVTETLGVVMLHPQQDEDELAEKLEHETE